MRNILWVIFGMLGTLALLAVVSLGEWFGFFSMIGAAP